MEYKFMTPVEVWQECDPCSEPLDYRVVRSEEKEGVIYEKIYFTVKKTEKGEVRAYAVTARSKKKTKLPVVLITPPFSGKEISDELFRDAVQDGYLAVAVDLEGVAEGKKRYTFYPDDLDYCNKARAGRRMYYAEPSARDTVWYNWTYVIRRTLTLIGELECAESEKIVLVGIDEGCNLAWQSVAMDKRISGCVTVFGCNLDGEEEDKEERDCWLSGVDQMSYAPFVTVPMLHVGGTSTKDEIISITERTVEKMKSEAEFYSDFAFGNGHVLFARQINTIKEFVKKVFAGEKFADTPTFDIETGIDGELKIKINAPGARSAEIWYSYVDDSEKMFWKKVDAGRRNGEIIANFSLALNDEKVIIFARANYGKYSVSSRPKFLNTTHTGASVPERRSTRILFDGTQDKMLVPVVEGELVYDNTLEVKEGALGLLGVTAGRGGFSYVLDPEQPTGIKVAESMQLELFVPEEFVMTVRFYSGEDVYSVKKKVKAGSSWQRVHLSSSAFKNADMKKLLSFEEVWKIEIPELRGTLVRNVLLI